MSTTVAIIGAGGKMGTRISNNLRKGNYTLFFCEKGEAGIARLQDLGLTVTPAETAAAQADMVILAVPDALMRFVTAEVVPMTKQGATVSC